MIVYDSHIHMSSRHPASPEDFLKKSSAAGISGGLILSIPPVGNPDAYGVDIPAFERMEKVRDFCKACGPEFFPCFWIDVLEKDAVEQVKLAKETGMRALKIICSRHAPSACIPVCREAVKYDLPVLFHSGILWDGVDSGNYNRPCDFECMTEVPGLTFALAHISWPWTDECIAFYGKMLHANSAHKRNIRLFIDDAPGTPDIYRRNVFRNFALLGYDLSETLLFGVDTNVSNYNTEWAEYTLNFDRELFASLNDEFQNFDGYLAKAVFEKQNTPRPNLNDWFTNSTSRNLLRFLGEIR